MGKICIQSISKFIIVALCAGFWALFGTGHLSVWASLPGPVVLSPLSAMITHDTTPDVVLAAPSGTTITIYDGTQPVGTGNGSDHSPVTITLAPLSKGVHSLTAQTTMAGLSGTSSITTLPAIIVDDSKPFDIQDVVALGPDLHAWNFDGGSSTVDLIKRNLNFLLQGVDSHSVEEIPSAPAASVTVTPGTAAGTTQINTNSDLHAFRYLISKFPLAAPKLGSMAPADSVSYHPGDNISGVDAVDQKYVGFYETDDQGHVLKFAFILLTAENIKQQTDTIINGIVMDDSESRAGNVTLKFREGSGNETGSIAATALTDNDGLYSIVLTPGIYTVEIGGDRYKTVFLTRHLVEGNSPDNDLMIERQDAPAASVTVAPGTEAGTTVINSQSSAYGLYYEVSSVPLHTPKLGEMVPSTAAMYMAGSNIYGVDKDTNKYIGFYEADDQGKVTKFAFITLNSNDIKASTIIGQVKDTEGGGVGGITIKFREGIDNRTGDIVGEAVSDSDGYYEVELNTGIHTAEIGGSGYVTSYLTRNLRAGTDSYNDLVVTAIPQGEDIRVVLTWGTEPRDLDSHLIGPTPDGDSFHIYYANRSYSVGDAVYAQLDLDQTSGQGPETTTIASVLQQVYGTYTFYVHNYSHEAELSQSSARVEVFKGSTPEPAYTFSVPVTGTTEEYWNVFDIIVTETGITIRENNILTETGPGFDFPQVSTMLSSNMQSAITRTSIIGISAMDYDITKSGKVQVELGNQTLAGLSKQDFQVRASVNNVTKGITFHPQISTFSYDPSTRILTFDPHHLTDDSDPLDELEVTLTVGPSAGSARLTGDPVQETFFKMPTLVFLPDTQ